MGSRCCRLLDGCNTGLLYLRVLSGDFVVFVLDECSRGRVGSTSYLGGSVSVLGCHGHGELIPGQLLELLLPRGADVSARDREGNTALALTQAYRLADIATMLENAGAE